MATKIIRTFKYRIYPAKRQKTILSTQLALCCELYNAALQERRDAWRINRKSVSFRAQSEQLPEIKRERPELADVYSQTLQDVLHRVDKAFQSFFRRIKQGKKPGFPRFHSRIRYDSLTYPQLGFSVDGDRVKLSKVGRVHVKMHRPIEGKIKTLTITRSSTGKWFACFSVEIEPDILRPNCEAVGIDVGLSHFATLSTGEQIPNPRFFREEQSALAKAQRNGKRKAARRIHERIKFRRHNFAHQRIRFLDQ